MAYNHQSSAVGCFGSTIESWLLKDIIRCMSKEITMGLKNYSQFQFIYPIYYNISVENYKQSFDCQNLIVVCRTRQKDIRWQKSYS